MAVASGLSLEQISFVADWHLTEDALKAASIDLINFASRLPMSQFIVVEIHAPADGMRFYVPGNILAADYSHVLQMGFAVQLCTLRWRGHFLGDTRQVPVSVLATIASQLGVLPMPIEGYPQNEKTRFEHLERIRQQLKFARCGAAPMLGRTAFTKPWRRSVVFTKRCTF